MLGWWLSSKESSSKAGDLGSVLGWRGADSLEKEMTDPLQYSCLGNLMDRGAWWATVDGVAKSWTQLSKHTHTSGVNRFTKYRFGNIQATTNASNNCQLAAATAPTHKKKPQSTEWVMSSSVTLFSSCPQSLPVSESFPG